MQSFCLPKYRMLPILPCVVLDRIVCSRRTYGTREHNHRGELHDQHGNHGATGARGGAHRAARRGGAVRARGGGGPGPRAGAEYYVLRGQRRGHGSDGNCTDAANTTCTLRDALCAAAAGDTITFNAGVTAATLTIDHYPDGSSRSRGRTRGRRWREARRQRRPQFSIFMVNGGATANDPSRSRAASVTDFGGGIYNGGTLTLTDSTVAATLGMAPSGGGIFNNGGTVTLTNSTVSGNTAGTAAAASTCSTARDADEQHRERQHRRLQQRRHHHLRHA